MRRLRACGSTSKDLHAREKLVVKLRGAGGSLHLVYEAGPCGFVIQRRLQPLGEDRIVVKPSLIPKTSGDRVKTDRRAARQWAWLHWAGDPGAEAIPKRQIPPQARAVVSST